jgi:hypothetical protein
VDRSVPEAVRSGESLQTRGLGVSSGRCVPQGAQLRTAGTRVRPHWQAANTNSTDNTAAPHNHLLPSLPQRSSTPCKIQDEPPPTHDHEPWTMNREHGCLLTAFTHGPHHDLLREEGHPHCSAWGFFALACQPSQGSQLLNLLQLDLRSQLVRGADGRDERGLVQVQHLLASGGVVR